MLNESIFETMTHLPGHRGLCRDILRFFQNEAGVVGGLISGSGAQGGMDRYSDLDLGFLCESDEARDRIWRRRLEWKLPAWFHRMDADHVRDHFIIYLFEPDIHVDLVFYTWDDHPKAAGSPFKVAWDATGRLESLIDRLNTFRADIPDWSNVVHEEERFWTWIHYSWCHAGRGEYYDAASFIRDLRFLVETWHARLHHGTDRLNTRRLEARGPDRWIGELSECFPSPDRESLKMALLRMIAVHARQRRQVESAIGPKWTTTQAARDKITAMIEGL